MYSHSECGYDKEENDRYKSGSLSVPETAMCDKKAVVEKRDCLKTVLKCETVCDLGISGHSAKSAPHVLNQHSCKDIRDSKITSRSTSANESLSKITNKQSTFFAKYFPVFDDESNHLHWKKQLSKMSLNKMRLAEDSSNTDSKEIGYQSGIFPCSSTTADSSQIHSSQFQSTTPPVTDVGDTPVSWMCVDGNQPVRDGSHGHLKAAATSTNQKCIPVGSVSASSEKRLTASFGDIMSSVTVGNQSTRTLPGEVQPSTSDSVIQRANSLCEGSSFGSMNLCKSDRTACDPPLADRQAQEEMCVDETPHSTSIHSRTSQKDSSLCQVCEDVAAGFYCGAFVCEACKKFFIRASKQEKQKFVCLRQQMCKITKESRVQCQYCRYQKCLQLKMYNPGEGKKLVNSIHVSGIPCRVCGSPSSGFHFGALTCEGCKGFFRRMVKEREPGMYKCSTGGVCEISAQTRNMCKACRYQKCLNIGMSVEGSRIGRQPNAVKHAISMEVKKQRLEHPGSSTICPGNQSSSSVSAKESGSGDANGSFRVPPIPVITPCSSGSLPPTVEVKEEMIPTLSLTNMELTEISPEVVVKQEPVADEYEDEETAYSVQLAGKELAHMCVVDRAKSETLDKAVFKSYPSMWKRQMKHFEFHAQCVLRFSKKVPGFRDLVLDDQVALVQNAIYPIVVLNHARSYELETGFYNFFNFSKPEEHVVLEMCPEYTMLQSHFKHMGMMAQSLQMSDMEYTLLSCLLLFNTDCPGIQSEKQIGQLQTRYMRFFQKHEKEAHENGVHRFGELMLRISELILASMQHVQTMSSFLSRHPDLEVPQLYKEMFF